jgi:hypothetical protein
MNTSRRTGLSRVSHYVNNLPAWQGMLAIVVFSTLLVLLADVVGG